MKIKFNRMIAFLCSSYRLLFSKYLSRSNQYELIYGLRGAKQSRLFSSYSMRPKKTFALSDGELLKQVANQKLSDYFLISLRWG